MHHTQLPDTTLSDKVCSACPLAGSSSVAPDFVADLSLLESCNRSTITSNSLGDPRFQDSDFTSHYLSNQQFSITAVTTSTGAVAERYAYTAYGQPTFLDASGTPLTTQTSTLNARYMYTGREWDATLGLYHFRARWMSGVAGRFLTRDPIGYVDGPSIYHVKMHLANMDPEGLAVLDADPTSSNGAPWCYDNFPTIVGGKRVQGDTQMWLGTTRVVCRYVCCSDGYCDGNAKKGPICTVIVRMTVKISRQRTWDKKYVYGHEQYHVDNFLDKAKDIQRRLTTAENGRCVNEEQCAVFAKVLEDDGTGLLEDAWNEEADHNHGTKPPLDGVPYLPKSEMPKDPQQACQPPSEPKSFAEPDDCLYRPNANRGKLSK